MSNLSLKAPPTNSCSGLSTAQRESIREYLSQALNEDDRKRRKKEIVTKYNLTHGVVNALEAHIKIRLNRQNRCAETIKIVPPIVSKTISNNVSIEVKRPAHAKNTSSIVNPVGKARLIATFQDILRSEPECIFDHIEIEAEINGVSQEAMELFVKQNLQGSHSVIERVRFDLQTSGKPERSGEECGGTPFPNSSIVSQEEDTKAHARMGESMGALVNYDNAVKNAWRKKLKEFIDENTDPANRKDMKVLCLPGIECLEIPSYLELGFQPENIIGVEVGIVGGKIDSSAIARFQKNAKKFGIQTRIGKIEKILETEETVFDVVSLDFLGQFSSKLVDITMFLKL